MRELRDMRLVIELKDLKQSTSSSSRENSCCCLKLEEPIRRESKKMESRGRMINKLALVLLSIVILELILIGDQVQPVKAIKKKIYLKKLKKLLPLLALVKPKKKIILVPIPFPMFKNQGQQMIPHQQHHQSRPMPMPMPMPVPLPLPMPQMPQMPMPMSFMMMNNEPNESGLVGMSLDGPLMPVTMSGSSSMDPAGFAEPRPAPVRPLNGSADGGQPTSMMLPSMTMTIQSEPGGSSNIELSTNLNAMSGNASAPLQLQRPQSGAKWVHQQQQHQQDQYDSFDEPAAFEQPGGEQYYRSPWAARERAPLASPAKVFRGERLRAVPVQMQPQQSRQQLRLMASPAPPSGQEQRRQLPVVVLRNEWRPTQSARQQQVEQQQQQQQQVAEFEELVPIGPAQMMPVYQTANGQLHMSPPPPSPRPTESEEVALSRAPEPAEPSARPAQPQPQQQQAQQQQKGAKGASQVAAKLQSPASKGKQQQQRPTKTAGGY